MSILNMRQTKYSELNGSKHPLNLIGSSFLRECNFDPLLYVSHIIYWYCSQCKSHLTL